MKRFGRIEASYIVAAVAGIALCFNRLFGVHGVESALVLGLVLPPLVGWMAARCVVEARTSRAGIDLSSLLKAAGGRAVVTLLIPVVLLWANSLRVPQCDPAQGIGFIALGPGFAVMLATCAGLLAGVTVPRPRLACVIGASIPLACFGLEAFELWRSPAVFAYSHFAGYFPGPLYDEDVRLGTEYVTFRCITLLWIAGLLACIHALIEPIVTRFTLRRFGQRPVTTLIASACIIVAGFLSAHGARFGHAADRDVLAEELGATKWSQRCVVHAPRELDRNELSRLASDCDFRVRQSERALGVRQRDRVRVFLFRSAEEKKRLVGAGVTSVATPWRGELYVQVSGWPHPLLFHEIVHVVAANAATGLLKVPGTLGGLLPNPVLIEGVAVAIAWDERDEHTPHEAARALLDIGKMPAIADILGPSFFAQAPAHAYTAAGSFLRYLLDKEGSDALRQAYATNDLATAFAHPLSALEGEWRRFLRTVPITERQLEMARTRFARRSIFDVPCPHRVAELRADLALDVASRDLLRAARTCREILAIDPGENPTRSAYAAVLLRLRRERDAAIELERLEGPPPAPLPLILAARRAKADAMWSRRHFSEALTIYQAMRGAALPESELRSIEVKALALEAGTPQNELVAALFGIQDGVPPQSAVVVHLARELRAIRSDGLGAYLEGRQLASAGEYCRAEGLFNEARARSLPSELIHQENRRLLATAAFACGHYDAATTFWREAAHDRDLPEIRRHEARDWLERIEFANGR